MQDVFLSCCGLRRDQSEKSILTSLPCELFFNDVRDAERRSQKQEIRNAASLCAAVVKSGWARSPLQKITLDSRDWAEKDASRQLKATILSNARQNDKELGVTMSELTNKARCAHITKPHEPSRRLQLFCCLLREFRRDPSVDLEKLVSNSWPCRMLCPCTLWSLTEDHSGKIRLVVGAGPHIVKYTAVHAVEFNGLLHFRFDTQQPEVYETLRFDGISGQLSMALGVASPEHGLLFKPVAWLTPKRYLLSNRITEMTAAWTAQFCRATGIQGSKLTHKERVQRLLESEAYPADYIEEVLESLPEPRIRARAPANSGDQQVPCLINQLQWKARPILETVTLVLALTWPRKPILPMRMTAPMRKTSKIKKTCWRR